eukprot:scaffold33106_cov70-Phaeocystis_antarctica.AAC.1
MSAVGFIINSSRRDLFRPESVLAPPPEAHREARLAALHKVPPARRDVKHLTRAEHQVDVRRAREAREARVVVVLRVDDLRAVHVRPVQVWVEALRVRRRVEADVLGAYDLGKQVVHAVEVQRRRGAARPQPRVDGHLVRVRVRVKVEW